MAAPIAVRRPNEDPAYPWRFYVERQDNPRRFYDYDDSTSFENALASGLRAHREMIEEQDVTITRDSQQTDVIYVGYPVQKHIFGNGLMVFVTPDGIGRYYFDTVKQARDDMGHDLPIRYVSKIED